MSSKVGDLISDVKNGRIGLPDIQRPFVWKDDKERNLLDSMLRGFPIGYIMLWESAAEYGRMSHIEKNNTVYDSPDDLVIDGQQRLMALLAAFEGISIKDKDYMPHKIKDGIITQDWKDPHISAAASVCAGHGISGREWKEVREGL